MGKDENILIDARERFKLAQDAYSEINRDAVTDLKFSFGDQWPTDLKQERDLDKRPCLVINRIPQFIRQITNDQRQNKPSIKVSPVDDEADVKTAEIYQGIIRHIEYSSNAKSAYNTAFDWAVRTGLGWFRIVPEYCDPYSFNQEIKIKRISNRFTTYLDPAFTEFDGSDSEWGNISEILTKNAFKELYPKSELSLMPEWEMIGGQYPYWITDSDHCRVVEDFCRDYKNIKIVQFSNGHVLSDVKEDEVRTFLERFNSVLQPGQLPLEVIRERDSSVPFVKWIKHNGIEILEQTELPGKYIPIIPVVGEEINIEGRRNFQGIVRTAMDSQRMYNYWASSETETIALAPRAPFIGYEGQFEGHEKQWETANRKNHAFLQVKAVPFGANGAVLPLPQRNVFEAPVQAITNARMLASEDLKATTGIYDAALGAQANEKSGVAIQRRAMQAQMSNFHFVDNLSQSIAHGGRIITDWIPHYYDAPQAIRILGEEGNEEVIRINEEFERKGEVVNYDLSKGKYDVTVSTGPSYETKRQEAAEMMMDLTKALPAQAAMFADLLVKNLDLPGNQEIAERIKKTLPPGIADGDDKTPVPPQVQAQVQQMNQVIEVLTQKLNESQDKIENKTLELESKERIALAQIQAQLQIKMAELGSKESIVLLQAQIQEIENRMALLNANIPVGEETVAPAQPPQGFETAMIEPDQFESMPIEQQQPIGGLPPSTTTGETL